MRAKAVSGDCLIFLNMAQEFLTESPDTYKLGVQAEKIHIIVQISIKRQVWEESMEWAEYGDLKVIQLSHCFGFCFIGTKASPEFLEEMYTFLPKSW